MDARRRSAADEPLQAEQPLHPGLVAQRLDERPVLRVDEKHRDREQRLPCVGLRRLALLHDRVQNDGCRRAAEPLYLGLEPPQAEGRVRKGEQDALEAARVHREPSSVTHLPRIDEYAGRKATHGALPRREFPLSSPG